MLEQNNTVPQEQEKANQQKTDLQFYAQSWIWRAVECLVEAPDFEPSPKWSAKRLNISIDKVVDAFEGLERLGYIKREGNSYIKPTEYVAVDTSHITRENLIQSHSNLAPQIITRLTTEDKFTTWFFNADAQLISEFTPKFMKLYKEMNDEGLRRQCRDVFASEISFAQLTEKQNNGGLQ
jgi:hypothetical protein